MYIGHSVLDNPPHGLQPLERPHGRDRVALHQDVALGQQLEGLQRRPVRPEDPLPPLDKALLVPHQVADLDDVGRHAVVQDLDRLRRRHGAGEQLDQVACV